ncbi:c-type cytochrome [Terrimonas ginsenosidimutans]|uniref:c-type cytochrome n=1 Tax=Terrimonas ginsenosidimutans TaxID=2908004 RepID=UPI003D7936B8
MAEYQQTILDKIDQEFFEGKKLFEDKNCQTCHRVTGLHSDLFTSSVKNEY